MSPSASGPRDADDGLTVGVEEEFLLVDSDGQLARAGPAVVRAAVEREGELHAELNRSQVESATGVCTGVEQLLAQLSGLRAALAAQAAARGLRLLPSGTPPLTQLSSAGITPTPRYESMGRAFGAVADSTTSCGCHVHVGIADRVTRVQVSNHLRPWLPVLLALTANSPYVEGRDTGYSSWRYLQWTQWPTAGPPPMFESLGHYEDRVAGMLRLEAALDRGMIYWDIRLSEKQPTVEFRVSDVVPTAREAALLAVVVRGLVRTALREIERGHAAPQLPLEILRASVWRAAHDGLGGRCPHPLTGELIPAAAIEPLLTSQLRPVVPDEEYKFLVAGLRELTRVGGGAQRQRAAYAKNQYLTDVIDELVHSCLS